jgi:hypothetical protein
MIGSNSGGVPLGDASEELIQQLKKALGDLGGGTKTLKKVVVTANLHEGNKATFTLPIPTDYEIYYNGQWHNKNMLGEVKLDDFTLQIPDMNWQVSESIDLKYYYLE